MCGIAGIRRFGDTPINVDQIKLFLNSLEDRGVDATGVALLTKRELHVLKSDKTAWNFCVSADFKGFMEEFLTDDTTVALMHTRAATVGNPREGKNNHPLTDGTVAVVHNGSVGNHEQLFKNGKFARVAETDSDILRAYVNEFGLTKECIRKMNADMTGSIAAAAIDTRDPERLLLLRSGSPLHIARVGDQLMWAREKHALHTVSRPGAVWMGFYVQSPGRLELIATPKDTGFVVGPEGIEWHGEFKTCTHYITPDYTKYRREYKARQAKFDEDFKKKQLEVSKDKAIVVRTEFTGGMSRTYYMCRTEKCDTVCWVPEDMLKGNLPLWKLRCPSCHAFLEEPPKAQVN